MSNFRERKRTLTDLKNAFHQVRIAGWLQGFFAPPAVLASEVGYTKKSDQPKKTCVPFFDLSCSDSTSYGFSWAMLICQYVADICTFAGNAGSPLFICRVDSTPPLFGGKHGMGSFPMVVY